MCTPARWQQRALAASCPLSGNEKALRAAPAGGRQQGTSNNSNNSKRGWPALRGADRGQHSMHAAQTLPDLAQASPWPTVGDKQPWGGSGRGQASPHGAFCHSMRPQPHKFSLSASGAGAPVRTRGASHCRPVAKSPLGPIRPQPRPNCAQNARLGQPARSLSYMLPAGACTPT